MLNYTFTSIEMRGFFKAALIQIRKHISTFTRPLYRFMKDLQLRRGTFDAKSKYTYVLQIRLSKEDYISNTRSSIFLARIARWGEEKSSYTSNIDGNCKYQFLQSIFE